MAFLAAFLAGAAGLSAEPLDKAACESLQAEKQALIVLGVDKEFAKGPEWAKANLAQAELNLLKRYITLDEQLKFRCGMAMVTLQIPDEPEDGPDDDSAPANAGTVPMPQRRDAAAAAKPAAKPAVPAPKTQPAAVKPAGAPAVPSAPAAPAVKPAPKSPAKAQSSWSTRTAPVESVAPTGVEQIDIYPRQDRRRPLETGG